MELIQPLYDIVKTTWTPICRFVDYVINPSKDFNELRRRVKELCNRRGDIKDEIDLVKLEKTTTRECNDWLESVEEIEKKMMEEEHHIGKKCFHGWFPDVIARVKLGKQVVEMIEQVKELQEKSRFEGGFVTDLKIVEKRPVDALIMGTLTKLALQKILDSIRDEGVKKIGIWGMGGVGKTTLMKHLHNMPEIQSMFDIVIWVTVSKSWSNRGILNEIAKRLRLPDVKDESDDRVSAMVCGKLEGMKYLLLLDDVWEKVNLNEVGIPSTSQERGSKIVLTTRDNGVCRRMETDVPIKVEVFDKEEAWELFSSKAGKISMHPTIKPIADEIVRKCGGLPLALKVAGGALRMVEDVNVWRNFLNKLNSPDMSYIKDMSEYVFKPLKASYDELKDTNIKNCFLYCGLYGEDEEIKKSKLITYWRAEGFLGSKVSLKDARVEGHALLHDLIDASLLEKCKDENYVKMHDVIRDLVLKMTSPGGGEIRFMVRAGLSKLKITDDDDDDKPEWEEASRISFIYTEGYTLPEMPKCAKLSTLLLQSRRPFHSLQKIPECFFNHMPNLRVLDLSGTDISTLPSSISNLVNLRALFLKRIYNFKVFPQEVSALQRLEVLHVVMNPPSQIWNLTSLKSLKLFTFPVDEEEMVPTPSVSISRLSLLEELSYRYILGDGKSEEAFAKELGSLTRLSSLKIFFPTKNGLKHFLHNSQPWRNQTIKKFYFNVEILRTRQIFTPKKYERYLFFNLDNCGKVVPSELNEVLIHSEYFYLVNCRTLPVLSDLGVKNVNGLKGFFVDDCELEYIVDEDGLRGNAFANLELLRLRSIKHIKSICDRLPMQQLSSSSSNSFTKLEQLFIYDCDNMKKVFSWGLIPQLLNLELLDIDNCRELEEIISVDFDEDNRLEHMNLPKLKLLRLSGLRQFIGFSKRKHLLHWPSLEEVTFYICPKLKIFPFAIDSAPNLRKIHYGIRQWREALKWEDDATKSRFRPLFDNSKSSWSTYSDYMYKKKIPF